MLYCSREVVGQTLEYLRQGGERHSETAVLWLGKRSPSGESVVEVFRPQQIADRDFFQIPPEAMRALLKYLRDKRLSILGQVHSHPAQAFHSAADDKWAVVRHVGALSLVVPWFASRTQIDTFSADIAAFQLDPKDHWQQVPPASVMEIVS